MQRASNKRSKMVASHFNICIVAGNIAFASLAFCFAFVIGATKLPELVMFAGVCSFTGVFLSYGATVAIVGVFGHSALPQRVALLLAGIVIALCLFCVSFGVMGDLDLAATHFVGGIVSGMLWLALLQNIYGWRIQPKDAELLFIPKAQLELRQLFYWMVGFAALFSLLRRSNVTSASIIAIVTMAVITSSIVLAIVTSIIRSQKNAVWMIGTFVLAIVGVFIVIFILKKVLPIPVPMVHSIIVASTNAGIVVAAIMVGLSFRLMCFTIVPTRSAQPQNRYHAKDGHLDSDTV